MGIKSYRTVKNTVQNTTVIERSKFICYVKGVDNEDDAKEFVSQIKKQNSLATHNCYAYIADDVGIVQKFSDDGEPQGTAGLPILEALKNAGITKCVAVVTRYFGGIKLGTGGLSRAYGGAVIECLKSATIIDAFLSKILEITSDYDSYSRLLKILANDDYSVVKTEFTDRIMVTVAVKKDAYNRLCCKLQDLYKGRDVVVEKEEIFCFFD